MTRGRTILLGLAVAFISISPLLWLFNGGGDIFLQLTYLQCFASQFWQGDVYPRWCMSANSGTGLPIFVFYFPLPYYIASIFYPLVKLGLSAYGVYTVSMFLAALVTLTTCTLWLRDLVTPGRAMLVAVLFLFLPYRMEALFFRAAYAELWAIAFLPLVFKYARQIAQAHSHATYKLALSFALVMLCHMPTAVVAGMASAIYMAVMGAGRRHYAIAVLLAAGLSAFYWLPAQYYRQFIHPFEATGSAEGWPNRHLQMENITQMHQYALVAFIALAGVVMLSCFALLYKRRHLLPSDFARREGVAWFAIVIAAAFVLLPVSEPLLALLGPLHDIILPWRMQNAFSLCLAWQVAMLAQYMLSARRLQTWKGDYAGLLGLLVLVAHSMVGIKDPEALALQEKLVAQQTIMQQEYRTRWVGDAHYTLGSQLSAFRQPAYSRAEIIGEAGDVEIEHFAPDGIVLHTNANAPMKLRLRQTYFPVWSAKLEDGTALNLFPEEETGRMLLELPAGEHTATLTYKLGDISGPGGWLAKGLSLLSGLVLLGLALRARKAALLATKPA